MIALAWMGAEAEGIAQELDSLISPGPLSRAHAGLAGLTNCTSCHAPGKGVTDEKCLSCHSELAARVQARRGFHKEKTGCVSCHSDHQGADFRLVRWDPAQFDHRETGYPLEGLHLRVESCDRCHRPPNAPERTMSPSFLLNDARCATCHEDVHRGALGASCADCHSTDVAFRDATFDHNRARFRLGGSHREVSCEKCHPNRKWRGIPFSSCGDCHQDRHEPSLGTDCERCHSEASWKKMSFRHETTRFPLRGRHVSLECSRCHAGQKFRGIAFGKCTDCHQDRHQPSLGTDCERCHSEASWKTTSFEHQATRFPLLGKHVGLQCSQCHAGTSFRGVAFGRCADCHRNDPHFGQFQEDCARCHKVEGFNRVAFDHEKSRYPLTGRHQAVACSKCHLTEKDSSFPLGVATAIRYRPLETMCKSCHLDPHYGQLEKCESCHATDGFHSENVKFVHDRDSRFALRGRHRKILCGECHRSERGKFPDGLAVAVRYKPIRDLCSACHENVHDELQWKTSKGSLSLRCESCHNEESFELREFDHARTSFPLEGAHSSLACDRCHDYAVLRERRYLLLGGEPRDCSSCHRSPHLKSMERCLDCHSTRTWTVSVWKGDAPDYGGMK